MNEQQKKSCTVMEIQKGKPLILIHKKGINMIYWRVKTTTTSNMDSTWIKKNLIKKLGRALE